MNDATDDPGCSGPRLEWEYGCVRCQSYHGESDGPIYREHLDFQSKHGLRKRQRRKDDGK